MSRALSMTFLCSVVAFGCSGGKGGAASTSDAATGVTPAGDGGGTGSGGGGEVNSTVCPGSTYRSAVMLSGAADPSLLQAYATALATAGYEAELHIPGEPAPPAEAPAEPPPAEDVGEPPPDVTEPVGDDPWPMKTYAVGRDKLQDRLYLLDNGDLVVASLCALESLGQVRRLDFALAAAVKILSGVQGGVSYETETARWAVPTAYYTDAAGAYQRQYLNDSLDLNKVHTGTISMSAAPKNGAAFGLYGHADTPSVVGDVVGIEKLIVGGATIAEQQKTTATADVVLLYDITSHVGAGTAEWSLDLLIADASVEWNVGRYWAFVDSVFAPPSTPSLVVTLQGSLPGPSRSSRAIAELSLPAP